MANNKYTIRYSSTYINQFNSILKYIVNNLINKLEKEIKQRSFSPDSYEEYISIRNRKNTYFRIYVDNYTVFYTVKDNTMEVRRILYSRRNFDKLI